MTDTLDLLDGKWKLLILHYLMLREDIYNTFKKIERDLDGISAKVLSKELKDLEFHQLVKRKRTKNKTHYSCLFHYRIWQNDKTYH